jgi:hypothetical protein
MNGMDGWDELPSLKSVKQTWKDFTSQFRRDNDPIPGNTTLSVMNVRKSFPWALLFLISCSRKLLLVLCLKRVSKQYSDTCFGASRWWITSILTVQLDGLVIWSANR